jgi:hypothetical protein
VAPLRFILGATISVLLAVHNAYAVDIPLLNFSDLLQHPIGPQGLEISPNAKSLHGQNVRLRGYMVKSEEDSIGQFYFAPVPIQLSEHADGPANDLPASAVLVKLDPSQANWAVSHKAGTLVLEGTLRVGRQEDAQGTVSWFQLQLPIH